MVRARLLARDRELWQLEDAWQKTCRGDAQLVTVWGRRRVGKTHLVAHFAADKRALWFGATQDANIAELGRLARCARRQLGAAVECLEDDAFTTWPAALASLGALAGEAPLLVVIDGMSAVLRSNPQFLDTVRNAWNELPARAGLMLVLVGSSAADVRITDDGGRHPARSIPVRLHVEPVDVTRARSFLPVLRPADFLEAYAACGGYPLHLLQWEQEATAEENLLRMATTTGGILMDHAEALLRDALPDTGGYMRILAAIGRVQTRYSEIMVAVDQRIDHPLDVLVRSGLVRRSVPVGAGETANATEYEFADTYLGFWFRVLYSNIPEIEAGQGAAVLRRAQPVWGRHVSCTFQDAARGHAFRLSQRGELPQDLVVGRWWSPASRDIAVEVLGLREGRPFLVGEANWSDHPLSLGDLAQLRRTLARLPRPVDDPVFALWGRHGVTPDVRGHALGFDVAAAVE